ncbi:uncharacterized protein LOC121726988 [Aricia agestis]|uniref:uncharacterized protein LOC121726988 n=1 Tax=Aricia agestis TaxID=91739 RepID=UPI001C20A4D5|nr:uncharacterized protein LOC121726988 [Aricia agestis]
MVMKNSSKYINIMQNTEPNIAVQDEGAVENVEQAKHAQEALAPKYDLEKELAGRTLADCVHETFNFGESSLTDVDKFKRRLIRSIARYTFVDKMPQNEMWEKLRKDTDCDCFLLMKRMRALTLKKLKRLLAAEDELENVTKVARLTTTDWLLFDLVLVHENVDLIGKDSKSEKTVEPKVLTELLELVSKYKIEKYQEYKLSLTTAWLLLTIEYNSRGRQCSPMLLQRRWYQMKQVTRLKFYTFWYSYRGNTTRLQQAWDKRPTELETKIAKRFPHLIIQPFREWEELVANEAVILREDFEKLTVVEPANNKNVDDVEIIETPVETIQVDEDSDVDDIETTQEQGVKLDTDATKQSNGGELGVRIVNVKTEPTDNNPNNISPKHEQSLDEMNRISHSSDINYNEDNELLPKIMNVTGGVELIESDDEADVLVPHHDLSKDSSEMKDNNKNTEINTPNCKVNSEDGSNILCSMSDSNKITDFADDRQDFEVQFDDLIIIDDGIAIEDDGIEDECEDMIQVKPETDQPKENTYEEEDTPKFDFKLLLTPVVYTKKLDDMDVFKFIDFSKVSDKRIIECSYKESKPVDIREKHKISKGLMSKSVEQEVIQDNIAQAKSERNVSIISELEHSTDSSNLISDHQKIKYSSWLLQKPKNRTYNPIQLCKNPDFNTRLKRLNAGFLMSERNRLMLKECKPLTVDLHKAFEIKMSDGTLYLQNSKFTHNCNKTLDSHSFVESKTIKTLEKNVDFLQEIPKNEHITTNVDLKSAESNHESNLKYEYTIKNKSEVLLETSPEIANQIHPLQMIENESKETKLNKNIHLKKDAYGSSATETNQNQQNSLKHNISGTKCYKENVDEKIEAKGYQYSIKREHMQDGINSSTEKVVNEKIEAQENNISLETEQIETCKDICDVDDVHKIEEDIIEPQESEPTNYRKGKKQLSRLQIQRSLSKLFMKVNYRSSTALPSRIPLKWDANSKPTQNNIKISDAYGDALLASSTLEKMINVLAYQPVDNKLKKHKRKKVLEHLTGQKIPWKKKNLNNVKGKNIDNISSDELKSAEDIDKNDNIGTEANGKVKNINNVTKVKKDKSKDKNGVATKQTKSRYCCWALEKLLTNKQPETPHYCPHPVCICCCRDRLLEKTLQDKKAIGPITKKRKVPNTENNLPANKSKSKTDIEIKDQVTAEPMSIILSDDDEVDAKDDSNIDEANKVNDCINVDTALSNLQELGHLNESNDGECLSVQSTVPSIQIKFTSPNQSTSSTQTSNSSFSQTCKTRVFARNSSNNNFNTSKTIEIPPLRVTFASNNQTPKPTGQMSPFSIQLENANVTKSNSRKDQFKYNILPHSTETSKPIFLGENKILLYSKDKPESAMPKQSSPMEGDLSSDPFTQSLLPPGVQIVLLPSGELALSIQPGLEFSSEEIAKLSDILMSVQQQLTTSVKNSSTTGNSETIGLVTQIANNEIPLQTKSNETILETKSSETEHPKELVSINNDDNSQGVVNIVPHDAESNAIDKNPDDRGIMLETQSLQTSNDTDSQINKKSILSDLMEMSGISEKDAVTEAKALNTSKKSPVTPVISLAPEMGLNQTELGTNTQNKICRSPTISASLESRKELSVVSSFDELKKCHEKSCQFYKMDIKTGEIYPINLKIKKKPLAPIKERKGKTLTTKVPSACIDLTQDQGDEVEKETEPTVVEKGNVKPVKLIRTIHSTGSNPTRSIILEPRQTSLRSQEPSQLVNILRSKRSLLKRYLDTGNDSSKPTILEGESENGGSRSPHSDSESDDEPLAKKALRKRDDNATMVYSPLTEPSEISGPIDSIENSLQCTEDVMDEELMDPEFMDPDSEGEDEGCILGV